MSPSPVISDAASFDLGAWTSLQLAHVEQALERWVAPEGQVPVSLAEPMRYGNLFLAGDVDKWDLHMLHWLAWERGCKSLYYLRSKSVQRASHAGGEALAAHVYAEGKTDYEECLACQ